MIEAKKRGVSVTEGLVQAKRLQTRIVYVTNGDCIYRLDMRTGTEGPVDAWPFPDAL